MQEEKEPSFKEMALGEKLLVIGGIGIVIFVSLAILAGATFFGITGVFRVFGITYESYTSILFFTLLVFLVGIPAEIIGKAFSLVIKRYTSLPDRFLTFFLDCFFNWITISIVDSFMNSIHIPLEIEFLLAILFSLVELAFDVKKPKKPMRA